MTQYGVWVTNKPVPFQRHRFSKSTEMQEGVIDSTDYKVAQRGAGANMSVDVAIGKAWLQIDSGARNGLAFVYSDALENIAVGASDATNPRLDQLVLQYNDTSIPAGVGGDVPTLRVVAGTPTAGCTLDTRNGAAALPADAVRLADILVPAASTSVVTANIRDRRPWARGVFQKYALTSGDVTTTSASFATIAAALSGRVELSGVPVRLAIRGSFKHTVASAAVLIAPRIDSALPDNASNNVMWQRVMHPTAANNLKVTEDHIATVAAPNNGAGQASAASGSHTVDAVMAVSTAGTLTASGVAGVPVHFTVEELVRQTADNT